MEKLIEHIEQLPICYQVALKYGHMIRLLPSRLLFSCPLSLGVLPAARFIVQKCFNWYVMKTLSPLNLTAVLSNSTSSGSNTIQVEGSTNQSKMTKCLRCISKLLTRAGNLFRKHIKVICEAEHVLENVNSPNEIFFVVYASLIDNISQSI